MFIDATTSWENAAGGFVRQLGPTNLVSPVDYYHGRMYVRHEVLEKPSDMLVAVQICVWQDKFSKETCSGCKDTKAPGGYYWDMRAPATWWKKTACDWTRKMDNVQVTHKANSCTGPQLKTTGCGAACYKGGDINKHVPTRLMAETMAYWSSARHRRYPRDCMSRKYEQQPVPCGSRF